MKIGKFAKENNISIDTIRHYMDLGLIIPVKEGGHYQFDNRCQKDLVDIITFKDMGFTLSEIKSIFSFKRFGNLTNYQEDQYYKGFFLEKHKEIIDKIDELNIIKEKLGEKIKELSLNQKSPSFKMGINLNALNLLKCPKCQGDLLLLDGQIINNQIINGTLKCNCDETYNIENGILVVKPLNDGRNFKYDFITDYVRETPSEYLDNLYKNLEWLHKKIDFDKFKNKVIIDLGVGVGFFLRHIYNVLPEDVYYIAVDHDMGRHIFLKNILEGLEIRKNIIFVCSDFLEIPIKEKSVDIVVDMTGSSNYAFHNKEFLLKSVDHYIKDKALLIGTYILFKKFGLDSIIPKTSRKNFMIDYIKKEIDDLNYNVIDDFISDYLSEGGRYEGYFKKDEVVYSYGIFSKR